MPQLTSLCSCSCTNFPTKLLKADASLGCNLSGAESLSAAGRRRKDGKGRQVSGRPNKCSLLSQKTAQIFKSEMNPRDIESTLHMETLKLGSKGSGDSVLVLMHVTYLAHSLCTYIQLTSTFLHALSPPDYWSGLGSTPPATVHVQNMLHSFDEAKKRKT